MPSDLLPSNGTTLQRLRPPIPKFAAPRRSRAPANDPVSVGLRKLWRDVEHEPVPAEFFDLLDAIDVARADSDTASRKSDTGGDDTGKAS